MVKKSSNCLVRSDWSIGVSRGSCINHRRMLVDPTAVLTPSPNRSPTTQTLTRTHTPPPSAPHRRHLLPDPPVPDPDLPLSAIPTPPPASPTPTAADLLITPSTGHPSFHHPSCPSRPLANKSREPIPLPSPYPHARDPGGDGRRRRRRPPSPSSMATTSSPRGPVRAGEADWQPWPHRSGGHSLDSDGGIWQPW